MMASKEKLLDEEEILQAVILADSFNKRFRPLTTQQPRVRLTTSLQCFPLPINTHTTMFFDLVFASDLQCAASRLDF